MDLNRNIYEGWTPQDFINELTPIFNILRPHVAWQKVSFKSRQDVARWCCDNQPYYKKQIPEVISHFWAIAQQDLKRQKEYEQTIGYSL